MKLVFDSALDGPAWPGVLGDSDHCDGQRWVGPLGLLGLLETQLGLAGLFDRSLQRACQLARRLEPLDGFWRRSFEVDRLGTCLRLLRDRDMLQMFGWRGEPVSCRLAELQGATAGAPPGIPDRLSAVLQAVMGGRKVCLESVISYTRLGSLPPLWRHVFAALSRQGVEVSEAELPMAASRGDLLGSRAAKFTPEGDGRLVLLRRQGPLEVADEVASALAAADSLEGTVIIGADAVLDQALARHGLPRVGAASTSTASSRLVLLVVKAAFHPMEVGDLHALLAAEPGPIPRHIGALLIRALRSSPGRGSPAWKEALAAALAKTEDRREELEGRVRELLMPCCSGREALPVADLLRRLEVLSSWARARVHLVPSLAEVVVLVSSLVETVDSLGARSLTWPQLQALHEDLGESRHTWHPAEVGFGQVRAPGAVLGPAKVIVWWRFSRAQAPTMERLLLSSADREGLARAGLEVPDVSLTAEVETRGWRRPLTQASEALFLCCPFTDEAGAPNPPHPLWDDIAASLTQHRDLRKLERDRLVFPAPSRRELAVLRPLVASAPVIALPAALSLRETESPSSLEQLLGCSLSWSLRHLARLDQGLSAAPPGVGPLLFGTLAHRLLEQVLAPSQTTPEDAEVRAGLLFDAHAEALCEDLGLPQHQASRATVRGAVVRSARALVALAQKLGVERTLLEAPVRLHVAGQEIAGRMDLAWSGPNIVLDLKWGKTTQVGKLKSGAALQLAAYAAMHEGGAEAGYFVLRSQDLLAAPAGLLEAEGWAPGQHGLSNVWSAAIQALRQRQGELASGQLHAPGVHGDDPVSGLSDGQLSIAPACEYCGYSRLCGRKGAR